MIERRMIFILLILVLPFIGWMIGWSAGPWLARANYIVQVAERVWQEETAGLEERTLQSDAFRLTGGIPAETLFSQALEIRDQFRTGAAWLGLWIGLVAALKIISILRTREGTEYEADRALCVACGRCYLACPVERERLNLNSELSGTNVVPNE